MPQTMVNGDNCETTPFKSAFTFQTTKLQLHALIQAGISRGKIMVKHPDEWSQKFTEDFLEKTTSPGTYQRVNERPVKFLRGKWLIIAKCQRDAL